MTLPSDRRMSWSKISYSFSRSSNFVPPHFGQTFLPFFLVEVSSSISACSGSSVSKGGSIRGSGSPHFAHLLSCRIW